MSFCHRGKDALELENRYHLAGITPIGYNIS